MVSTAMQLMVVIPLIAILGVSIALLVHLISARNDQVTIYTDQMEFWKAVVENFEESKREQKQSSSSPDFKNGYSYACSVAQIALFKLYSEDKLLDFDSLVNEIGTTVGFLENNPRILVEWNDKLSHYIQDRNEPLPDEAKGESPE